VTLLRPAVAADVPRLAEIELEAGALFRTVGLDEVAVHDADPDELRAFVDAAGPGSSRPTARSAAT
jgi:hypothetical protein